MFIRTTKKNKKAISIMIGYILLITFAVVIAAIVFQWLKSYVPQEGIECPDGVSLYIASYDNDGAGKLTLSLRNNGKFNFGGIFIRYSDDPEKEIAPFDLSPVVLSGGLNMNPGVKFTGNEDNSFKVNDEDRSIAFNVSDIPLIYSIEITPIRWQEEKTKKLKVSCTEAGTKSILNLNTSVETEVFEPITVDVVTVEVNTEVDDTQATIGRSGSGVGVPIGSGSSGGLSPGGDPPILPPTLG